MKKTFRIPTLKIDSRVDPESTSPHQSFASNINRCDSENKHVVGVAFKKQVFVPNESAASVVYARSQQSNFPDSNICNYASRGSHSRGVGDDHYLDEEIKEGIF